MTGSTLPTTTDSAPRRRATRGLAAICLTLAIAFLAACTPNTAEFDLLNKQRTSNGVPALTENFDLYIKAQAWAEQMARNGRISHSNLSAGLPSGWRIAGENVGCGPTVQSVYDAFMASDGHRANILNSAFNQAGVGIYQGGSCQTPTGTVHNAYWVVEVFVKM